MTFDLIDAAKIAAGIASVVLVWMYRRKISAIVADLVTNGEATRYREETPAEILDRVEARIREVLE